MLGERALWARAAPNEPCAVGHYHIPGNYGDPNPILINHSLRKYSAPERKLLVNAPPFSQYLQGVYKGEGEGIAHRQTVTGQGGLN